MHRIKRRIGSTILLTFMVFGFSGLTANAADYPTRPIDLIVNFGPGGGADGMGRTVAKLLAPVLSVSIPASNVAGAAGNTGLTKVANSNAFQLVI